MQARIVGLAAALAVAACARSTSTPTSPSTPVDFFGSLNGARIELAAEGGIAALSTTRRVTHDDRTFVFSMRHLCAPTACPAPMDSASGTLSPAAADSLFSVVWSLGSMELHDDYGTSNGAADMLEYTLRVTFDGTSKTVRADDGTMPPPMRQIIAILAGTIDTARAIAKR